MAHDMVENCFIQSSGTNLSSAKVVGFCDADVGRDASLAEPEVVPCEENPFFGEALCRFSFPAGGKTPEKTKSSWKAPCQSSALNLLCKSP